MPVLTRALIRSLNVFTLLVAGFVAGWVSALSFGPGGTLPTSLSGVLGVGRSANQASPEQLRQQFGVFWEVWDLVEAEYYQRSELNTTRMIQGAIRGMLASLDDQYTVYQEPELAAQTNDHLQGKLGGIGTYLRIADGKAFLYKPFHNGPAGEAGLKQDDEIVSVDGTNIAALIAGLDVNESAVKVSSLLRGPEGSLVKLDIRRAADGQIQHIPMTRRDIVVPSVEWQFFSGRIAYIRISEFKSTTTEEFDTAVRELLPQQPSGMVLDLRNNPGGYLSSAQDVLGRFYGGVALYEQDGAGTLKQLNTITGDADTHVGTIPLVVLLNGGSASASEIVAGALRIERPNTTLIGEKSYGKGSVQNIHQLSDGGSARITFAHWLTPDKSAIHEVGITPQYIVPYAEPADQLTPCVAERQPPPGQTLCGDSQLFAAIQLLSNGRSPDTPVVTK